MKNLQFILQSERLCAFQLRWGPRQSYPFLLLLIVIVLDGLAITYKEKEKSYRLETKSKVFFIYKLHDHWT